MILDALKKQYKVIEKFLILEQSPRLKIYVRIFKSDNSSKNKLPIYIVPGGPGSDGAFYYDHVPFLIKYIA